MAVQDSGGSFNTVLRMKDEASEVVATFGQKASEELGKASGAASEAGQQVEKAGGLSDVNFKKIGLGAAAAASAVAAFGISMVKSGLATADQADKMAKSIGISTEALTRLTFAAGASEVSSRQMTDSLIFMSKALARTADVGGKEIAVVLNRLGIEAEALKLLKPDEAFLQLADAIDKLENPMERAQAITLLFGKANKGMFDVIEGGSPKIRALMKEADELGVVISSKAAKASDEYADSLFRLQQNLGGITTQVTNAVAPAFADLARDLQRTVKESGALEVIAGAIIVTLKGLALVVNTISTAFGFAGKMVGGLAAILSALVRGEFREAVRAFSEMTKDLEESAKRSGDTYSKILGMQSEEPAAPPPKPAGPGQRQGRYGFRKQSFGEDGEGGGFIKTGGGFGGPEVYSDVSPGAELISGREEEERLVDEHLERVQEKHKQHNIYLGRIYTNARVVQFQVGQKYDKLGVESSAFFFGQLGGLMQTNSRKLFEIGKAGAIAETIIQTYRAAMGAYAAMASIPFVGPALGAAAAAAAIAVGFARVQAINSTQFGTASGSPVLSSGGATGPVVAGGSAVVPFESTQPRVSAAPAQTVNLYLTGEGSPTQSYIRDVLAPGLREALGDGVTLNVRTA